MYAVKLHRSKGDYGPCFLNVYTNEWPHIFVSKYWFCVVLFHSLVNMYLWRCMERAVDKCWQVANFCLRIPVGGNPSTRRISSERWPVLLHMWEPSHTTNGHAFEHAFQKCLVNMVSSFRRKVKWGNSNHVCFLINRTQCYYLYNLYTSSRF